MKEIKIGSVVELNSGGRKMTVLGISDDMVECGWILASGTVYTWLFHKDCLREPECPCSLPGTEDQYIVFTGNEAEEL